MRVNWIQQLINTFIFRCLACPSPNIIWRLLSIKSPLLKVLLIVQITRPSTASLMELGETWLLPLCMTHRAASTKGLSHAIRSYKLKHQIFIIYRSYLHYILIHHSPIRFTLRHSPSFTNSIYTYCSHLWRKNNQTVYSWLKKSRYI